MLVRLRDNDGSDFIKEVRVEMEVSEEAVLQSCSGDTLFERVWNKLCSFIEREQEDLPEDWFIDHITY